MLGKEAIVSFLIGKGIRHVFHLPGMHSLPLYESLLKSKIATVVGRHESALAFTAIGYAEATGRSGVLVVTPGPGLANTLSACLEAHGSEVPLLIIHIDTDRHKTGSGVLHELQQADRIFTGLVKGTLRVEREESLLPALEAAHSSAMSTRTGPVLLSIPYTLLDRECPPAVRQEQKDAKNKPDLDRLEEVLSGKQRPVIIGGGSLMTEELSLPLASLCRQSAIPFLTTAAGKGVLSENRLEAFGCVIRKGVVKRILDSADVVIAIGTRLRNADVKSRGVKIKELVHIDADNTWIGKNYPTRLAITGDLAASIDGICRIMKHARSAWPLEEMKELQKREEALLLRRSAGYRIIAVLREVIPEDTISVWDPNLIAYWAEYHFPVLRQRTFLQAGGSSTIFYGVPASIGAKLGRPDRPCLCVAGDGGGLPALGELAVAKQNAIPVVFLVYNNESYGILERYMKKRHGVKGSMRLANPDFVQLARSFDIPAEKAESVEDLKELFLHRIGWDRPFLIEFKYPDFPPPWEV